MSFQDKDKNNTDMKQELTWEDVKRIVKILAEGDWYDFEIADKLWSQEFYEEVLKIFNNEQERNSQ